MPRGDGTGPAGGGFGQGMGRGAGQGRGRFSGNRQGAGPGGVCICPNCGERIKHQPGMPCYSLKCPKCGTNLVRG